MKGQYYTILALIFAIIVAIFAISNSGPVDISFLYWHYSMSQALVILLSAAVGAIIVGIIGVFGQIRYSATIRGLNNRIKELEKEKEELIQKVTALQNYNLDRGKEEGEGEKGAHSI
ncbi:LapA family protein [Caldanaerobacter subterraneus]|uniref:LapA family protein n=1 Tax=Caldanaerobacter subterraneus TaxID=911092 RepID=A0A7Y2PMS7_9THEO|nr:LapA family protein [Caldanaerobacter subterraneus]NNG67418.1 LapA family protein [Caldanaerobacter subterraneus]